MTKGELHDAFPRNKRAEDIAAGLFVLLSQGRARRVPPEPGAKGRPAERWVAVA
jgi:hypothetical protein